MLTNIYVTSLLLNAIKILDSVFQHKLTTSVKSGLMVKSWIASMTTISLNAEETENSGSISKVGQRRTNYRNLLICFRRRKKVRAFTRESCGVRSRSGGSIGS